MLTRRINRGTILFGWITTIAALIAFYTALTVVIYGLAADLIEEQILSINAGLAAQIASRLDSELYETRAIGIEIANAPYSAAITSSPIDEMIEYSWAYRDLVEYIRVTESIHSWIERISIIFPDDTAILDNDGFPRPGQTGESEGMLRQARSFAETARIHPEWDRFAWITAGPGRFSYLQLLGNTNLSVLEITLDAEVIATSLRQIPTKYGGEQFILDSAGTVVFSSGGTAPASSAHLPVGDVTAGPRSEIVPHLGALAGIRSEITDLSCWSFIPEPLYLSDLRRLRTLFLCVAGVVATAFLVLTIYFIVVHYAPIRTIIGTLETNAAGAISHTNEYRRILEYSQALLAENKINQDQLRRFEKNLENRFLERFLTGSLAFQELPDDLRTRIGIDQETGGYRLIVTKIAGSGCLPELYSLYLSGILPALPGDRDVLIHTHIEDTVAILVKEENRDTKSTDALQQHLDSGNASFSRGTTLTPYTVISDPFSSVNSIGDHYASSRRTVEEAEFFGNTRTVLGGAPERTRFLYLEHQEEERLTAAVREGSYTEAARVTDRIMARIETTQAVGVDAARSLIFSALTAVIQTVTSSPVPTDEYLASCRPSIAEFFSGEDIHSMKRSLLTVINVSCSEISQRRTDHVRRLITRIEEYADNHLSDPEMYLPSIAAHFGLNPKYLSALYKEHQGISIAETIRRKRIERACTLLRNGLPVHHIAEMTGFANVVSFNRTFRRITGTTPTEYRRNIDLPPQDTRGR